MIDSTEAARTLVALRPIRELTCAKCGQPFETRSMGTYCSDRCRWRAANRARAERKRAQRGDI